MVTAPADSWGRQPTGVILGRFLQHRPQMSANFGSSCSALEEISPPLSDTFPLTTSYLSSGLIALSKRLDNRQATRILESIVLAIKGRISIQHLQPSEVEVTIFLYVCADLADSGKQHFQFFAKLQCH